MTDQITAPKREAQGERSEAVSDKSKPSGIEAASLWSEASRVLAGKGNTKLPSEFADASSFSLGETKPTIGDSLQKVRAFPGVREIVDAPNPIREISKGIDKLSNLESVEISRRANGWQHVNAKLETATTGDAPNISVGRHRPVASHMDRNISFDLAKTNDGIRLANMSGFTTDVQGPRGRIRTSHTNEMTLGHDNSGPFLRSTGSTQGLLRMRTNTVSLRENDFNKDSPMRSIMNQPEALKQVGEAMRLFQNTDDVQRMSMKKSGTGQFDVASEAMREKHIEVNKRLENSKAIVSSIDLERNISATIQSGSDAVGLANIKGIKVNMQTEILGLKTNMTIVPSAIKLEKGVDGKPAVKLDLALPDGSTTQFSLPLSKLREAQRKAS
ncbi:hypothetical protein KBI23_04265 [bacterium]|nr:hypothetical protein [bacterium]MBP9807318.1 hypothetical protein [bacterium]